MGTHESSRGTGREADGRMRPLPTNSTRRRNVAVDVSEVSKLDVEPGELPKTMAAWVIRAEREGEPKDAFQLEEIEVPRARRLRGDRARDGRGRQLQQRLGGARQARLRVRLRRPSRVGAPHRRLRRLRHRLEGRRGRHQVEARRRGRDPLQPGLLRGRRGARPRPARRPEPADLGLRDDLGVVRPVHQGPGPAAAAEAAEPVLGRVLGLRPHLLHRLPDADRPLQDPGGPQRADLGRRRRAGRVRHPALRGGGRQRGRRRLLRREGGAGQEARRRRLHQPQRVRRDDAKGRRVARGGEGALQGLARRSPSASRRSSATPPTSSSSTSARRPSRPRCWS